MKHLSPLIHIVILACSIAVTSKVQATENWSHAAYIETRVPLNIRTTPYFRGKKNIIQTLKPGTIMLVMDQTASGHLHVRTAQGIEGYIINSQRYLKQFNPQVQESNDLKTSSVATSVQSVLSNSQGLLMPLCGCTHARCRMTSPFGMRTHPISRRRAMHLGVDLGGPTGQPIRAAEDGVVGRDTKRSRSGWGNRIVLTHKETLKDNKGKVVSTKGYETQYNHLQKILVKAGQRVKRGDVIGTLGNTGRSTGPHLDFNVRANGKYMDPMLFFEKDSVKYSKAMVNTTAACPVTSTVPGSANQTTTRSVR